MHQALTAHYAPSSEAHRITSHEADHENADKWGPGQLGILLATATIHFIEVINDTWRQVTKTIQVAIGAFYRPIGERTPEQMVEIAKAPSDMSDQDKRIAAHNRSLAAIKKTTKEVVVFPKPKDSQKYQDLPLAA